jgi:predicted ATPase/DNA-binding SARP family transcriptional activator
MSSIISGATARLELRILGDFELRRGSEIIHQWPRIGPRQLLKRLAVSERQTANAEALAESFWPNDTGARVMRRLHHLVYLLRKTLEPGVPGSSIVHSGNGIVRLLTGDALWIDLVEFEQRLNGSSASLHDGEGGRDSESAADKDVRLEQALSLYRGRLLSDDRDEDWLSLRRLHTEGLFVAASHRLAKQQAQQGRPQAAAQTLQRLLQQVPSDEAAHRELISAYGRLGRREDVQRQFNECIFALQHLDAEPDAQTHAAYKEAQALSRAVQNPLPNAASTAALAQAAPAHTSRRWSVPRPLVQLLGRDDALQSVAQQLREQTRLLSLVGTGGVGKTQLAIRIAYDLQQTYPQGACFVPLAESRPGELYPAVARALGLKLPRHEEPKATLWRALQHSRLLLVLDNFEHMLAEAAELTPMLQHCEHLSLLVTSRMRLNLVAETCVTVPPLTVDQEGEECPDALRMFIACAQRVRPGVQWGGSDADEAAAITRCLDGLPMAIELAAARLPLFSPGELRRAIETSLQVVTGGGADRPRRQRSLRDSFGWSFALLSANEQALLMQLSLCDASFDHRDARGLAGAGVKDPELELQTLVELGFVMPASVRAGTPDAPVESRFQIAAAMREFVRQELLQNAERDLLHRRFIDHFIQRADRLDASINATDWDAARLALAEFGDQNPNFFAALMLARENEAPEAVCRLVASLARLWPYSGTWHEAKAWIEWASAKVLATAPVYRSRLMTNVAAYWREYRSIDQATEAAALAIQFAEEAHQPTEHLHALLAAFGLRWGERGDRGAVALLRQAEQLAHQLGDDRLTGWVVTTVVDFETSDGNLETKRKALEACENEFKHADDVGTRLRRHMDLVVANLYMGDYVEAHTRFDHALSLKQRTVAQPAWCATTLMFRAGVYCVQMDAKNAQRTASLAREAVRDAQAEDIMPSLAWLEGQMAMLACDWHKAVALLRSGLSYTPKDNEPWEALEALLACAWAAMQIESDDLAGEALSALVGSTSMNTLDYPRVAQAAAVWLLRQGHEKTAALAWLQADALRRRKGIMQFPIDRAMSEETRVDLMHRLGDDWEVWWQAKTPACDGDRPLAWLADVVSNVRQSRGDATQPIEQPQPAGAGQSTACTVPPAHRARSTPRPSAPATSASIAPTLVPASATSATPIRRSG